MQQNRPTLAKCHSSNHQHESSPSNVSQMWRSGTAPGIRGHDTSATSAAAMEQSQSPSSYSIYWTYGEIGNRASTSSSAAVNIAVFVSWIRMYSRLVARIRFIRECTMGGLFFRYLRWRWSVNGSENGVSVIGFTRKLERVSA